MKLPSVYAGKILVVNLAEGKTEVLDTAPYAERFLGGRGIATKLYWDLVPPEAAAFDGENCLIAAVGPMAGLPAIGGSRWGLFGKSPFPEGDRFCYGNLGGYFGAELKFAGFDALVVRGKAPELSVLVVRGGARPGESPGVEVVPAMEFGEKGLAGMAADKTIETVKNGPILMESGDAENGSSGRTPRVMAIGPAGENLVPIATVFADGDASCGGGMGAVMGSKNLKAAAVLRGAAGWKMPKESGPPAESGRVDREGLKAIEQEIRGYGRGNVKVWGLDFMAHGENTKKLPCYGCMAKCLRVKYTAKNGKSGKYMCQSRFFYMSHAWGYYKEENDVPFLANRLCDEYGVDTWEVQGVIEWLLRCHAEGLITSEESGLDLDAVGSLEFIRDLVEMIAHKRGFGELLALGAEKASRKYAKQSAKPEAAGLYRRNDPYDLRYCTVNIMLLPFETREPIQQLHEAGLVLSQWSSWAKGVEEAHISSEVVRGIARRFWGSDAAADMTTLAGKAEAAVRIQNRQFAKESAEICDWMFPVIDNPSGADDVKRVGESSVEARLLSAALGREITEEEYYRFGERVFTLQRSVLLREGHRAPEEDVLPREFHEDPLEYHVADPDCLVPGPKGKIHSQVGNRIEMKAYRRLKEEYYQLRGWDAKTGLPSIKRLKELGLGEVAADLAERGLAVKRAGKSSLTRRVAGWVLRNFLDGDRLGGADSNGRGLGETGKGEPSLDAEKLQTLMEEQQAKFTDPAIAHNFAGWNKTMHYYFPDIDGHYVLEIKNGEGQVPRRVEAPPKKPEIYYEMSTETLRAMTRGEISGFAAYKERRLKLKASFTDMMKLQSLNKV
jgi:aldehyde:ferredoxin oxidoreductase